MQENRTTWQYEGLATDEDGDPVQFDPPSENVPPGFTGVLLMSGSILAFNIVTFQPDGGNGNATGSDGSGDGSGDGSSGGAIALLFENDFKWSCGLKPDVNVARASYLEMAKFGGNYAVTGTLNFYYTSNPGAASDDDSDSSDSGDENNGSGTPDLSIANVRVIEVRPTKFGIPLGATSVQPIEWEIHFADWRYGFVAPRGGRLRWAVVNPSNVQPVDTNDPNINSGGNANDLQYPNGSAANPIPCSQLIDACLDAMNRYDITYAAGVDDTDPPLDLQWHGTHAPTELEKLLDHVGAVFCPHFDGNATIELISNTGPDPVIPDGQLIGSFPTGALDHRGTTVVFSSADTHPSDPQHPGDERKDLGICHSGLRQKLEVAQR